VPCFVCLLLDKLISEFAGELKVILTMATGLEPREQRLLFRGAEAAVQGQGARGHRPPPHGWGEGQGQDPVP
jgi:hypothetical protein